MKRSQSIRLILIGGLSTATLTGCTPKPSVSAENVYTNTPSDENLLQLRASKRQFLEMRATTFTKSVQRLAGILALGLSTSLVPAESSTNNPSTTFEILPPSADLRPAFAEWKLEPRQQGARGTCSVFTMVGALEFAAAKREGHGERLSVEFLNWSANQRRHPGDGGFFSDMWRGFSAYGICSEQQMPYQDGFDLSRKPDATALANAKARLNLGLQQHWIKEWNINTGLTSGEFVGVKHKLNEGWPVCGGFRWPNNPVWNEGVLQMCPSNAVFDGHSVLLVGYRDDASQAGGGVFLFRNSNHGGADGWMPYAYAQAYMNDAMWIDSPAKTAMLDARSTPSQSRQ